MSLTRRAFLTRTAIVGCSAAASPLVTPIALASAPWDNRLVVIILRGGMDGLDVVRPLGDPNYRQLGRPTALGGPDGALDLNGYFALAPGLAPLMPFWKAGQLGFVHAVSTPYRDKRSHFDGQDLLEAGTDALTGSVRDGWLNRMLQTVPGMTSDIAYAVGHDPMTVLDGPAPTRDWAPDADLRLSPQAILLAEQVMNDDPLFRAAYDQALTLADADGDPVAIVQNDGAMMADMQSDMAAARRGSSVRKVAKFAAQRLREDTRIAAFSISGWDTHRQQDRVLLRALNQLSQSILELRKSLGHVWNKTTVLAMTEFGRTARINGSAGTDHGTAGAMLIAGGAVKGGQVWSDWPGLAEADLYDRRDLMPTRDIRAHAAWVMQGMFGIETGLLERSIFPGLDMGPDPRLLL